MKTKNIIKHFALLLALALISSCDKGGDPDPGATVPVEFSGDWYLKTFDAAGNDLTGYALFSTYNTAANTNEIWVDDNGNIFPFKAKATVDLNAHTFNASSVVNASADTLTVTITNGQLLMDQATSTGGNVVDSLYFQIEISDDPGTIYTVAGYKRTGLLEDEH